MNFFHQTRLHTVIKIAESVFPVIQQAMTMLSQRKVWYSDFNINRLLLWNERWRTVENNLFTNIKYARVYEQIVEQIRELIQEGKILPGERLPGERDLSTMLGCSRTSLREALRVLEAEGIVIAKPGGGRYVQNVDQRLVMEYSFDPVDLMKTTSIIYFLEVREMIEPNIAALACERATEEDILKMERALLKVEAERKDIDEKLVRDSMFHLALAEATHNFVLVTTLETNLNMLQQIRLKTLLSPDRLERSSAEHRAIFDAVKSRKPKEASEAMAAHLQRLRESILNNQ
jgi:GntR family transcriptional repressor for pyruvate dehydrogenase complex